ncbi:MAG: hypothetical protein BWX85_01396 [Chloroflexi bacterium ADurb.Bin120]|jgi:hypothetical protein|nr:MAG: hypothetical protein BWX85_01396 [Chloroflexi bacterium ADurb.Bin120]
MGVRAIGRKAYLGFGNFMRGELNHRNWKLVYCDAFLGAFFDGVCVEERLKRNTCHIKRAVKLWYSE